MAETFSAWLLSKRKRLQLTQADVARLAKVSKAYVGHIENNRSYATGKAMKPTRDIVVKLARAVDGDLNEALLLAGYAPEERQVESRNVLDGVTIQFDRSVDLSEDEKDKILTAVRLIAAGIRSESQK